MSIEDFNEKLDKSFDICIYELTHPSPNWEERISEIKFTIDINTMKPIDHIDFEFDLSGENDNIYVNKNSHTFVFKRSVFYRKFEKSFNNRMKLTLQEFYHKKNLEVDLFESGPKKWILRLSWINNEIKNPNIVVRIPFNNKGKRF